MGDSPLARFTRIKHPVAREEDLLVEQVADETVVYDNRTKEAHCLSPLAAVVFAHCDGRTTVDQLATLAAERLGEPIDPPRVVDALEQLQERDLLAVPPRDGMSRRQMVGKSAAAAGALAGASLITTIAAPSAIAANTATCGIVTCCPCCNPGGGCDAGLDKQECCEAEGTVNCQCSAADSRTTNVCAPCDTGKYCKPGGNNYFTDQLCDSLFQPSPDTATALQFRIACANAQGSATNFPNVSPPRGCRCATCQDTSPVAPGANGCTTC